MTLNCKLLTFLLIIKLNYSQRLKIRYFYSLLNAACTSQKLIDKIFICNKISLYEKVSLLKQEISETTNLQKLYFAIIWINNTHRMYIERKPCPRWIKIFLVLL